ncbi:MAG: tripartite tricarboxylate transporter substrate binding protein [Alphaproteobacteria bacterium]|nr:tripartite tricarboxylate transporter substrate binding protein [Alphaproteobacteria bacterium]
MQMLLRAAAAALMSFAAVTAAAAQDRFPNRPVKIVVPFPAGGPTDVNMRILGQKLSEMWGQGVVIENRPGANTGIAASAVAKSPADGYTLLAAMDTTLVMNAATGVSMSYDPFKDFAAITLTAKNTSLLTVRAEDGPKTIAELIARGRASKTKLTYGAGITITRLAGQRFAKAAGFEVVLVPYKGSAEVVQGLLTKSVDFIVDGIAPSLPLIRDGRFRPLAKLNNRHLSMLPDVKPLAEASGLPIEEMSSWISLVAPAGTPKAVVDKIHADVVKAYADAAVADRLEKAGIAAVTTTPKELDDFYRSEAARWTKFYKESGLKLE